MCDCLFGYIRVCKPELKIKEFAEYKSVYCSICKYMGKTFGRLTRLTLSYDSAFLAMLAISVKENSSINFFSAHCPLNPLKKCSFCTSPNDEIAFSSSVSVLLTYYKLKDDVNDSKFFKKVISYLMLLMFKHSYRKARCAIPTVDSIIAKQMKRQQEIELNPNAGIDLCAEPSALMLSSIAEMLSSNEKQKIILKEFGYLLGRWIYLVDAADDLEKDLRQDNFNPFIKMFNLENSTLSSALYDKIEPVLNQTLGRLTSVYKLLVVNKFKNILDNIIYYGMAEMQRKVIKKEKSDVCE